MAELRLLYAERPAAAAARLVSVMQYVEAGQCQCFSVIMDSHLRSSDLRQ